MSEERDYEKEAIADGWNPNFDGEGKKDAQTFVEDGEKISGMLKAKIGRLEDRIDSQSHTFAEFKQYTDGQRKKDAKENERLVSELEKVKAQAITDGDGVAAVNADREIQNLQVKEPPPQERNVAGDIWFSNNEWYAKNPVLHAHADFVADQLRSEGVNDQSPAFFDELTKRVKEASPQEFENPNRNKAGSVESGGAKEVKDSKAQTWANLPDEAKAAAKRFEKDIPGFKREDYLSTYEWE